MSKQAVFFLPGILGTEMETREPIIPNLLWVNPVRLALGHVEHLALASGGLQPKLGMGETCYALTPLEDYYGPAYERLSNDLDDSKYDVIAWGYDWRTDIMFTGNRLAEAILSRATSDNPCSIVAHSQGGLLARMAYFVLNSQGKANLIRRIVTIGTPHEGTYSPVIVWHGEDEVIDQIRRAETITAGLASRVPINPLPGLPHSALEIAAVTATWPSLYELLPLVNERTLADDPLRAAVYMAALYDEDAEVSQTWLNYANGPWNSMLNSPLSQPPDTVLIAVAGRGFQTPARLAIAEFPLDTAALEFDSEGDGRVTVASASPPWASGETVWGAHGDLMVRQAVLGSLRYWVEIVFNTSPPPDDWVLWPASTPQAPVSKAVEGPPFTHTPPLGYDP